MRSLSATWEWTLILAAGSATGFTGNDNEMKIAAAQINSTVGDFAGNAARIRAAMDKARAAGAKLVVTPEMARSNVDFQFPDVGNARP